MTPFKYLFFFALYIVVFASCKQEESKDKSSAAELDFDLLGTDNLNGFQDLKAKNWQITGNVFMNRQVSNQVSPEEGKGILLNMPAGGQAENLITKLEHADVDLLLEFMLPPGSQSGIYFQGRYKILLADSWRKDSADAASCGAIVQPASMNGAATTVPLLNVCKAPGLWQQLFVRFKAPRFNASGQKIANAWFEQVVLNGKTIQEHVEVAAPQNGSPLEGEKPMGPLVFQGSGGAIAFHNIRYKSYDEKKIVLSNLQFQEYKGTFRNYDTLKNFTPVKTGKTDSLSFRLVEKKNQLVVTGTADIPKDGTYQFQISAAGPAWVFIDDQEVINNEFDGDFSHPYYNQVQLKSGQHSFRCIYSNLYESLVIRYEGPGIPFTTLTTPSSERKSDFIPPMEYALQYNEPLFQRGFFLHKGKIDPYTMSVGIPGGLNYAYDLSACTLLSAWRGKYVDVSNMWESRGETQREVPLGGLIEFDGKPAMSELSKPDADWPDTVNVDNNMYSSRGYRIADNGLPVFQYAYKTASVEDEISAATDKSGLVRKITVRQPGANLYWLLASGKQIEKLPDGTYAIDNKQYYLGAPHGIDPRQLQVIKKSDDRYELLCPVSSSTTFSYSIIW